MIESPKNMLSRKKISRADKSFSLKLTCSSLVWAGQLRFKDISIQILHPTNSNASVRCLGRMLALLEDHMEFSWLAGMQKRRQQGAKPPLQTIEWHDEFPSAIHRFFKTSIEAA